MTISDLRKTPFPWPGGKADAADHVWAAHGDVDHYAELFFGSGAVLMRRPHPANRTYYSETVNDLDGFVVNAFRSIARSPDATAEAASWPVCEADLHARHLQLLKWRAEGRLESLMGDPEWHDPVMAGWWIWGTCCWIGTGWCSGRGPWIVGDDGRITRRPKGSGGVGVYRPLPHLGNRGVNHPGTREPGVIWPEAADYHPLTMPELRRWIGFLSARLRHVRILNGDWKRLATSGALKTLPVRQGGVCGVFLDPPYDAGERYKQVYTCDDDTVGEGSTAHQVREWCAAHGDDRQYRIVLAGYDTEHASLEALGWTVVEWFKPGFLKGGMGNTRKRSADEDDDSPLHQQRRERLWLSPHCLRADTARQGSLW